MATPISLTKRSGLSVPVSTVQNDANMDDIQTAVNTIIGEVNTNTAAIATVTPLLQYGEMLISDGTVEVTITALSTWYTITTFETGTVNGVTFSTTNNTLVMPAGTFHVAAVVVANNDGTPATYEWGFSVDGSIDSTHSVQNYHLTANLDTIALQGIMTFTANQELTVAVKNVTGTTNITTKYSQFIARRLA